MNNPFQAASFAPSTTTFASPWSLAYLDLTTSPVMCILSVMVVSGVASCVTVFVVTLTKWNAYPNDTLPLALKLAVNTLAYLGPVTSTYTVRDTE